VSDDPAFLAAILDAPDDDAPRLVYADRLEDMGQHERADFVRVGCELARMRRWSSEQFLVLPESRAGRYIEALRSRHAALLRAHGFGWCDGLFGPAWKTDGRIKAVDAVTVQFFTTRPTSAYSGRTSDVIVMFDRGFIGALEFNPDDGLPALDSIRAAHPIRAVRLSDWPTIQMNNLGDLPAGANCRYRLADGRNHSDGSDWHYGRMRDMDPGTPGYGAAVLRLFAERWPGITFDLRGPGS
jgi:uncharacterized protein (TIGR02996 family)